MLSRALGFAIVGITLCALGLQSAAGENEPDAPAVPKVQIPTPPAKIMKEQIPTPPAKIVKEQIPTLPAKIVRERIPTLPTKIVQERIPTLPAKVAPRETIPTPPAKVTPREAIPSPPAKEKKSEVPKDGTNAKDLFLPNRETEKKADVKKDKS